MTHKQGLELLKEKLAAADKSPSQGEPAPAPLPPALVEFARQMALRNGVEPESGEVMAASAKRQ